MADIFLTDKDWNELLALIATKLNISDYKTTFSADAIVEGVLPIERGGTGASTVPGVLAKLGLSHFAQVATGSYEGSNDYGNGYTLSLTFPFKPKLVFVTCTTHDSEEHEPWVYGQQAARLGVIELSWTENGVSWSVTNVSDHLNQGGLTYVWVAIG